MAHSKPNLSPVHVTVVVAVVEFVFTFPDVRERCMLIKFNWKGDDVAWTRGCEVFKGWAFKVWGWGMGDGE